jgi:hypothetical protein
MPAGYGVARLRRYPRSSTMGVFRRHEPAKELATTLGGFVVRTDEDDEDEESCWFCGRAVGAEDGAALVVEPFGGGEPSRTICHVTCVERTRGLLEP